MTPSAPTTQTDSIRAAYDEALAAFRRGDVEQAENLCRRALPLYRNEPNIMSLLGEICLQQRRPQEAQTWFGKVLKNHHGYPRALEGMGLALLAVDRPQEAVDFLREAADKAPQRSLTRMALARALDQLNKPREAHQAAQQALALDPRKAALAKAEEAQMHGRIDEAEKILRTLLGKHPDDPKALRMLANIALEANRFKAARRMLERVLELAPRSAMGWCDLANLNMKQDRYDEALQNVQKAMDIDPQLAHSHVMRGNILTRAQRHEESLDAYRQALEFSPHNAGALAGMGHVLKTIGRTAESIAAYRKCIAAHPAFGEAYWSLANLKTFEFDPAEVEQMERLVDEAPLPDEPKVNICLSLGKHYENEADYDRAFEYFRRGNELRRRHEVYDPVQTQVIHDRIIEVFSAEFFERHKGYGDPDPAPILVVGLPRSGSTLIEQILASHSRVEGTMELPDLSRTIGELNKRSPGKLEYPEAVLEISEQQAAELGAGYIASTMRYRTGLPHFIDKMPNNFASIGFLKLILPNARVINARRHPLDSCVGSYKQLFFKGQSFTYDQFELGEYYLQYQRLMDHWHMVLPGQVLDVHYEAVVRDQELQTRRMLEYLGLPFEPQCLRFYETERAINTASSEQVRQPIYTKALNFWRHYERHLDELIQTLEPLLRQLPEEDQPAVLRHND